MVCLILDLSHLSNHSFCDPLGLWRGDGEKMRPPPHYWEKWLAPSSHTNILEICFLNMCSICVCAKLLHSCPTFYHPMDCSPPGSSVHGIFQGRILEWVAMPFSRKSSLPRDWTWVFCIAGRFFALSHQGRSFIILHHVKKFRLPLKVKEWLPTPIFLPGEFCGQRSLEDCHPWGGKESDRTNIFTFFLKLSRVTEGVAATCMHIRKISQLSVSN